MPAHTGAAELSVSLVGLAGYRNQRRNIIAKGKIGRCQVYGLGILRQRRAGFYRQILGGGVILQTKREISLAVGQLIESQKSELWILHLCGFRSAKQNVPCGIVGTVALRPVLGSSMVMVWFSSAKFLTTDWVKTSKGRPKSMS